ncbi:MAG TPA: hypothetical protein VGG02_06810 [Chthoniobacterales bacterium]|jgi:hypothetical protein
MSWRALFALFVLTKEEQRTIAFVVLILILGLAAKHYRFTHPPNEKRIVPTPSPAYSPGMRP